MYSEYTIVHRIFQKGYHDFMEYSNENDLRWMGDDYSTISIIDKFKINKPPSSKPRVKSPYSLTLATVALKSKRCYACIAFLYS